MHNDIVLPLHTQPVGYIILIIWCVYLISLLATTVSSIIRPECINPLHALTFCSAETKYKEFVASIKVESSHV